MTTSSPKWKRGHALPLDTKGPVPRWVTEADMEFHDDASPRTKVARELGDLSLNRHPAPQCEENDLSHRAHMNVSTLSGHLQQRLLSDPRKDVAEIAAQRAASPIEPAPKRARPRSPPLSDEVSDEFWHDAEITGHDPDDPDDDGYGINGIGFRPTAAMAWSRSQRRKQQLTNYRAQTAKEARQERSERRKRVMGEVEEVPSTESSPRKNARVRFEDG